ncbi:MAG: replication factor C large subunit [Candidatus Micrarchaeia archaeon]
MKRGTRPLLWCEKHCPSSLEEFAGNQSAKDEVKKWALNLSRGKRVKPLLVYGPPGIGKTALAYALAAEMGWEVVETNASDLRDSETMHKLVGISSSSTSFFGNTRLLLFDEVDGAFDRGEIPEMIRIVRESTQPVMLLANDAWQQKLAPLRALCSLLEMRKVNSASVLEVLERIASAEGVECPFLSEIARNCNGDLRSAINDLQANCTGGAELVSTPARDREKNVFDAVKTVFKASSFQEAVLAAENVDVDLNLFVKWLEENVAVEYEDAGEVARALDWLSRGAVFEARIKKSQDYSLLKYIRSVSLAGVALSKKAPYPKFVKYSFPSSIKSLSSSMKSRSLLKSAALKVAAATHSSSREARTAFIPLLGGAKGAAKYFKFTEDEEVAVREATRRN